MAGRPRWKSGVAILALILVQAAPSAFARGHQLAFRSAPGYNFAGGTYFGGYYGGYSSPAYFPLPRAGSYLPPDWWAGQNAGVDPRQDGYNPSAGYAWDSVGALLLSTTPDNARVTLDGTYVGTANELGPFQLPMGKYKLQIDAPGYKSTQITLNVQKPSVQQLHIVLSRAHQASASLSK